MGTVFQLLSLPPSGIPHCTYTESAYVKMGLASIFAYPLPADHTAATLLIRQLITASALCGPRVGSVLRVDVTGIVKLDVQRPLEFVETYLDAMTGEVRAGSVFSNDQRALSNSYLFNEETGI